MGDLVVRFWNSAWILIKYVAVSKNKPFSRHVFNR